MDEVEPLRPELFRVALRLAGNAFDAEDLVHDALLRAFGSLGFASGEIRSPRAWLRRVLTNLWIDERRRAGPESSPEVVESAPDPAPRSPESDARLRDAAEVVLGVLSPRERAAVVLKESLGLPHAEIAELLSTSEGAVKVALHRARRRLAEGNPAPARSPRVSRELVDRFVAALRAHDVEALAPLLAESVEAHAFPSGVGVGREHAGRRGWLHGCLYHHIPRRERAREPYPLGLLVREVEDEPVVLVFRDYGEGAALEEVWRFEEEDGRIARITDYCFSPDLVRWVAERCGVPVRPVAYRARPGLYRDDAIPPDLERDPGGASPGRRRT